MTCIIIEDQPPAQRILQKYIADIGHLELKNIFTNALDALQYLNQEAVDLIFLDIHLPKISGLDFLKSSAPNAKVILTTAFTDYALESYEYNVVDYLLKPFSFQRFVQAVSKISMDGSVKPPISLTDSKQKKTPTSIFVKSGYDYINIGIREILYIKSHADYTEIFTKEKKHLTSMSLRHWLLKLQTYPLHQVHKSYVVNLDHVKKISSNRIILSNGNEIPIGRKYKDAFSKLILE